MRLPLRQHRQHQRQMSGEVAFYVFDYGREFVWLCIGRRRIKDSSLSALWFSQTHLEDNEIHRSVVFVKNINLSIIIVPLHLFALLILVFHSLIFIC
jgi:hypothetical protein